MSASDDVPMTDRSVRPEDSKHGDPALDRRRGWHPLGASVTAIPAGPPNVTACRRRRSRSARGRPRSARPRRPRSGPLDEGISGRRSKAAHRQASKGAAAVANPRSGSTRAMVPGRFRGSGRLTTPGFSPSDAMGFLRGIRGALRQSHDCVVFRRDEARFGEGPHALEPPVGVVDKTMRKAPSAAGSGWKNPTAANESFGSTLT